MAIAVLFILLFLLLLIGTPISFSLGLASVTTLIFFSNDSLASIALKLFESMEHYTLLAIPFFILSSTFLSTGGVAKRLIRFAMDCVGHLRGGMAIASVLACMLFAAVSGSSPATVVAIGSIVIAGMQKAGYSKEFAAGVICNAGTLGILIPPSIVMVVYAAATDVSVGKMFLAGVIPGLIAGGMLMVGIYVAARVKKLPRLPMASPKEIFLAFIDAFWGLFLIVVIMAGIYGGAFTPTEAAAMASVYAYFVAIFVYRDMGPLKDRPLIKVDLGNFFIDFIVGIILNTFDILRLIPIIIPKSIVNPEVRKTVLDAAKVTIMLLFIVANAMLFAHVLTTERIPQTITNVILGAGLDPWMFLIVVNILLLVAGNFMEPSAILLIMAPILFPIAVQLGIDPIHLGIIMVVNMEIGMITPPVGLNLFVTAGITGMPILSVVKAALPWLMILMVFLILITYVPIISTFLPDYVDSLKK